MTEHIAVIVHAIAGLADLASKVLAVLAVKQSRRRSADTGRETRRKRMVCVSREYAEYRCRRRGWRVSQSCIYLRVE